MKFDAAVLVWDKERKKFLPIHVHGILHIQKIHIASIDYKLDMYPNANKNGKLSYRQCQTFKSIIFSLLIVISCVRKFSKMFSSLFPATPSKPNQKTLNFPIIFCWYRNECKENIKFVFKKNPLCILYRFWCYFCSVYYCV